MVAGLANAATDGRVAAAGAFTVTERVATWSLKAVWSLMMAALNSLSMFPPLVLAWSFL